MKRIDKEIKEFILQAKLLNQRITQKIVINIINVY